MWTEKNPFRIQELGFGQDRWLAIALAATGLVAALDVLTPRGFAVGTLYVLVVVISALADRQGMVWLCAAFAAVLTVGGFTLSPAGFESGYTVANRAVSIVAIALTAALATIVLRHFRFLSERETESRARLLSLEEAQKLLDRAGHLARMGAWRVDFETWRVEWSDEVAAIHDMPPGTSPSVDEGINFYAPEWRGRIRELFEACARKGIPYDEELEIVTAKGKRKWVRAIGEAVRNVDGEIVSVRGAFQDLTPAKEAEAALTLSQRRFHQLAETLPQIIWTAEPDGTVDYVSGDFYRLTGLERVDLAAREWLQAIYVDDRESCVRRFEESIRSGEELQMELRLFSAAEQGYRWHLTIARPVRNDDGAIVKWFGSAIDIHDRRVAEEALAAAQRRTELLLAASGEGVHGLDAEGRIMFENRAAFAMLGYELEEVIGRPAHDLIHHHYSDGRPYPVEECPVYRTLRDGQTRHTEGEVFFRKDGSSFPVEYTCAPIIDEVTGAVTGAVVNFRDITEQRALEEQLRQSQRLEAIGQLTGGMAHDFNNLLTVILGNTESLTEQLGEDEHLRMLAETARLAAERGGELTHRLLAFARSQTLEPQPTDVNHLIGDMEPLLRRTLGEQIQIEIANAEGLWHAMIDEAQLESAILNLCINARDAMPDGGQLTIQTSNTYLDDGYAAQHTGVTPGQYVMIAVSDTGEGMDANTMARAFEPFFTTKEFGTGSGLGLSQIYGFIKQSAGHVRIYSEPGQGTTVKLYLPRASKDTAPEPIEAEEASSQTGTERILLVEDNELVREYVTAQVEALGYQVTAACNGAEALGLLQEGTPFDLLFTDVILPGGMTGRELADQAHELLPDLPVLFTSGYSENAVIHHGRLEPGVQLLHKPHSRQELARRIRATLDSGRGASSDRRG